MVLQSRIELHLEEGARLLFSPDPAHYLPVVKTRWEGTEVMAYSPLVYARDVEDVAITGPGTIDGNERSGFHAWHPKAEADFRRLRRMGFDGVPLARRVFGEGTHLRPPLVQILGGRRVRLEGYTARNSPFWVNHLVYVEHATVRGLRVDSRFPNNDGVDVDSSRNVLVEKCTFTTGDDSVVIKSGRDLDGRTIGRPSEDVVVRDNDMGGEDGIALGSEMSGGIRRVFFTDNVLRSGASAIRFKTNLDRGGTVEHVGVRNFKVGSFQTLFWFQLDYPSELGGRFPARYRNIVFENFEVADVGTLLEVHAPRDAPLTDVVLRNVRVASARTPVVVENVERLTFDRVTVGGREVAAPSPRRPVKFLGSLFAATVHRSEARQNLKALGRFLLLLLAITVLFAVVFHVIMGQVEGQEHSWVTGFYWALTVMTTLGFGDITFHSDIGRIFTILVLVTGVVLLLLVLPFTFIQFFYAPWLEAKLRLRAPRVLPAATRGHVVIARWDAIGAGLAHRLRRYGIPYVVLEPDPAAAARLMDDEVSVLTGEIDSRTTYENARVGAARLLVANCEDTTNTNVTLTAREVSGSVPIASIVASEESVDVLRLTGCTHTLPLKKWLGEHLANRTDTGRAEAHVIGGFKGLQLAEFAVRHTPLAGRRVRETRLREVSGVNVVGVWERGRLRPAFPDTPLGEDSVVVVAGMPDQVAGLETLLQGGRTVARPVLILGCGKVGWAAAESLHAKGHAGLRHGPRAGAGSSGSGGSPIVSTRATPPTATS